jgi:hypothetical protein
MYTWQCHKEISCIALLNKQKYRFFSFTKLEEGRTGPEWGGGTSGREEDVGKSCRRVNIVQILCTYVCKWKNETYARME